MKRLFVFLGVLLMTVAVYAEKGPRVSDKEFYDGLDYSIAGLHDVEVAAKQGDYSAAGKALASYYRKRTFPKWHYTWQNRPAPVEKPDKKIMHEANEVMEHRLTSVNVKHQFGDRIDWSINPMPTQYCEWTWQLSRHKCWEDLRKAYWLTGDTKYAKEFAKQMSEWVEDNPPPPNSGNVEWSRWRTIETGIRNMNNWPNCFFTFLDTPEFTDEAIVIMLKSFYDHGTHLRKYPTGGNWLCMEMCGLYNIGALFPEFKTSKEWSQFAVNKIYAQMEIQFLPDGAQFELTPGYHGVALHCIENIMETAHLNKLELPADYLKRIEKMYEYYLRIMRPDDKVPAVNDSGRTNVREFLPTGLKYFPHRKDFQYVLTYGKEGTRPNFLSCTMPNAGWIMFRSDWTKDALYMHFDVGPTGNGHIHEDKLSMIICGYGSELMSEGWTYPYDRSAQRKYTLSAFSHNTTLVDGLPQRRVGRDDLKVSRTPMTNRFETTPDYDFGEGWYDDGFGKIDNCIVRQYRAITFVKHKFWVLVDKFTPKDGQPHDYTTIFHFSYKDGVILDPNTKATCSANPDGANLAIIPANPQGLEVEIACDRDDKKGNLQGMVFDNGYKMRPVATPLYKRHADGEWTEAYVLYPLRKGEQNQVKSAVISGREVVVTLLDGTVHKVNLDH